MGTGHVLLTPAECTCDGRGQCPFCDGGIMYCKVCHGGERELDGDCPGPERTQPDAGCARANALYRISEGHDGSAFGYLGDFALSDFPAALAFIAAYLGANPDVVDLAITTADGRHVVVRKGEA